MKTFNNKSKNIESKHIEEQFVEIVELIKKSRSNALKSVNAELITLYWNIGKYISIKIQKAEWGESVVTSLAGYIQNTYPELRGYSDKNLWRMKQFYETYINSKLSALLRELSWTNNILIFSKSKTFEEREFYIRLSIQERYSSRELERQIDSGYYERAILSKKVSPVVSQIDKMELSNFKDTYVLEFLNLPDIFEESEFRKSLVNNFKKFVLEFGKDFAFVGEEYRISVGNNDYFIDLVFYHRELQCLVAFELKIDDFKPEYLGKLNFYLEALDRDVKKKHENPSVGIILCKSKDKEVVEYALSRNASPAMISEYKTQLIPKKLLQNKLHELTMSS
jgi:predicted nuclease of restriction endonuclease-like (RecB) superfamily